MAETDELKRPLFAGGTAFNRSRLRTFWVDGTMT
jgi:hypothetical protein